PRGRWAGSARRGSAARAGLPVRVLGRRCSLVSSGNDFDDGAAVRGHGGGGPGDGLGGDLAEERGEPGGVAGVAVEDLGGGEAAGAAQHRVVAAQELGGDAGLDAAQFGLVDALGDAGELFADAGHDGVGVAGGRHERLDEQGGGASGGEGFGHEGGVGGDGGGGAVAVDEAFGQSGGVAVG